MSNAAASGGPDRIADLEKRVKELEDYKRNVDMLTGLAGKLAAGVTVAGAGGALLYFVIHYALLTSEVASLRASVKEGRDRLQMWEDKGFRLAAQAFPRDGEFVSLKGDRITLLAEDQDFRKVEQTFTVDPGLKVLAGERDVPLRELKLAPGARVRFMLDAAGTHVASLELLDPKK
jgi:hypothetical protein